MSHGAVTLDPEDVDAMVRILLLGMREDPEHPDPPNVIDMVHLLIEVRQAGGAFTGVGSRSPVAPVAPRCDTGWTPPDDGGHDDELVDQRDVARELDLSARTLQRDHDRGLLTMVDTPRGRKIRRGEANRYADARRTRGR